MNIQWMLSWGFRRRWGRKHKSTSENLQSSRTSGTDYPSEMLEQREQFGYIWALAATPMASLSSSWGMRYGLVSVEEKPLLTQLLPQHDPSKDFSSYIDFLGRSQPHCHLQRGSVSTHLKKFILPGVGTRLDQPLLISSPPLVLFKPRTKNKEEWETGRKTSGYWGSRFTPATLKFLLLKAS